MECSDWIEKDFSGWAIEVISIEVRTILSIWKVFRTIDVTQNRLWPFREFTHPSAHDPLAIPMTKLHNSPPLKMKIVTDNAQWVTRTVQQGYGTCIYKAGYSSNITCGQFSIYSSCCRSFVHYIILCFHFKSHLILTSLQIRVTSLL